MKGKGDERAGGDVPMAVNILVATAFRWLSFGLAFCAGAAALAARSRHWTPWLTAPLAILSACGFAAGILNRPSGRLGADRAGPYVILPGPKPARQIPDPSGPRGGDGGARPGEANVS